MANFINCPHCSAPFDTEDEKILAERNVEVCDDRVYIISDYVCPHCRRVTRGTQQSYDIPMWFAEEFEAV